MTIGMGPLKNPKTALKKSFYTDCFGGLFLNMWNFSHPQNRP